MKPRSELAKTKERELVRAGRLLLGAFFGGSSMEEGLSQAVEEETRADAIDVGSYVALRCASCTREIALPSSTPTSAVEQMGWRTEPAIGGTHVWRCDTCAAGTKGSSTR